MDGAGYGRHGPPVCTGFPALLRVRLDPYLVEAAGVEPASASTLPLALHA